MQSKFAPAEGVFTGGNGPVTGQETQIQPLLEIAVAVAQRTTRPSCPNRAFGTLHDPLPLPAYRSEPGSRSRPTPPGSGQI